MRPIALDSLDVLIVVDNETDTLSSVDEGVPQRPELAARLARTPRRAIGDAQCCEAFGGLCLACHGFSALLTGRRGGESHAVLFDVGPDARVWLDNAERLAIDLASIELVFLSHWHHDHSGALPEVVRAITRARADRGHAPPIVDVHPDRPDQRGGMNPDGTLVLLYPEPTLESLRDAGGQVDTPRDPHLLGNGFFYASGAIERRTPYETGLAAHYSIRDGRVEHDPLIMDERFVACEVTGRGVVVLSACSHAGVVNACLAAGDAFAGAQIALVLGGFHLAGRKMEERIEATVRDLTERVHPQLVAPGHCTGWRAKAALARAFSPSHYAPSVVGSRYALEALAQVS
jgi:7,8-dihydropterin-6-yl-methyl-4-(beta-D-ribofuranosyl)aminobenzene 5'-phosphate synthase